MTPYVFAILFWSGFTGCWFLIARSVLRNRNSNKRGYRMTGHMAILAGFQTLAFTFIIASNSDLEWLRLMYRLGWFLLFFTPFMLMAAIFAVIRLLYGRDPE